MIFIIAIGLPPSGNGQIQERDSMKWETIHKTIQRRYKITKETTKIQKQRTNIKEYYKTQVEQLEKNKQKQTVIIKRTEGKLHTAT